MGRSAGRRFVLATMGLGCMARLATSLVGKARADNPDPQHPLVGPWYVVIQCDGSNVYHDILSDPTDGVLPTRNGNVRVGPRRGTITITFDGGTYSVTGLGDVSGLQSNDTELGFMTTEGGQSGRGGPPYRKTTKYYIRLEDAAPDQISGKWQDHSVSVDNAYGMNGAEYWGTLLGTRTLAEKAPTGPADDWVPTVRPGGTGAKPQ